MSEWTYSKQKGTPGHCFVAQVWDENGNSLLEVTPTDDPEIASSVAMKCSALIELLDACEQTLDKLDYLMNLWGKEGVTNTIAELLRNAVNKAHGLKK